MVKDMAKGIKISDLSKDFSMKSKDVIEKFKAVNIDKTTSGTVSDEEFAVFMQHITLKHQISNLDEYRSGKATIKSGAAKSAPKAEEKPEYTAIQTIDKLKATATRRSISSFKKELIFFKAVGTI